SRPPGAVRPGRAPLRREHAHDAAEGVPRRTRDPRAGRARLLRHAREEEPGVVKGFFVAVLLIARVAHAEGPCESLAGRYVAGDGYVGTVLELSADCGAAIVMSSDAGDGWKGRAEGRREGDALRFPEESVKGHAPASWVAVRWGARLYLVPQSGLDVFCDA